MSRRYVKSKIETLHNEMKKYSDWLKISIEQARSEMEDVNQTINQIS